MGHDLSRFLGRMPSRPAGMLFHEVIATMNAYSTLRDLVENDPRPAEQLFDRLPPDAQVALQEQRQEICTYADLERAAASFERRGRGW